MGIIVASVQVCGLPCLTKLSCERREGGSTMHHPFLCLHPNLLLSLSSTDGVTVPLYLGMYTRAPSKNKNILPTFLPHECLHVHYSSFCLPDHDINTAVTR